MMRVGMITEACSRHTRPEEGRVTMGVLAREGTAGARPEVRVGV